MFAYVHLGNANPYSSDWEGLKGRRWPRGDPEVTFGHQPKASGKGTGCGSGRRPDFMAFEIVSLRKTGDAAGHKIGTWKRYV